MATAVGAETQSQQPGASFGSPAGVQRPEGLGPSSASGHKQGVGGYGAAGT